MWVRIQRSVTAFGAALLLGVELLVGIGEQLFDALAMSFVDRNADARGQRRLFRIAGHDRPDTVSNALRFIELCFRKNESELVATVTRSSIDGAAMDAQNMGEAIESVAADQMAVGVINFLQ